MNSFINSSVRLFRGLAKGGKGKLLPAIRFLFWPAELEKNIFYYSVCKKIAVFQQFSVYSFSVA